MTLNIFLAVKILFKGSFKDMLIPILCFVGGEVPCGRLPTVATEVFWDVEIKLICSALSKVIYKTPLFLFVLPSRKLLHTEYLKRLQEL